MRLWTTRDVARYLARSEGTVLEYVRNQGLPFVPLAGRSRAYVPESVQEWARRRQTAIAATSPPTASKASPIPSPPSAWDGIDRLRSKRHPRIHP